MLCDTTVKKWLHCCLTFYNVDPLCIFRFVYYYMSSVAYNHLLFMRYRSHSLIRFIQDIYYDKIYMINCAGFKILVLAAIIGIYLRDTLQTGVLRHSITLVNGIDSSLVDVGAIE